MGSYSFDSVIFDLDGIITKTASVHAEAWKKTFDEYLKMRSARDNEPYEEFTHDGDYLTYVDGKPRYEGVDSFLRSRGIELPTGEISDGPDKETVCGIGNRKNERFKEVLEKQGPQVYEPTVEFVRSLRDAGIKVGVASSSKNCQLILQAAGLEDLFETRVDGVVSLELGLKGKPEGDIFVKAARNLASVPERSVVLEDATSGVKAGRNGGFGMVIGVARRGNEEALLANGADIAVDTLKNVSINIIEEFFRKRPRQLFKEWDEVRSRYSPASEAVPETGSFKVNPNYDRPAKEFFSGDKKPVFFLDYDGTLTPIVESPELARVSDEMRKKVKALSEKYTVAVVSGRMREDVEQLLDVKGIFYAGSHGFDIKGDNFSMIHPGAEKTIPLVDKVIKKLHSSLDGIDGCLIEEKKFSVAVHYRRVDEKQVPAVAEVVDKIIASESLLRLLKGKKVFEILPDIDWDKGKAIRWIMKAFEKDWKDVSVVYMGDDTTDEYAFRAIRTRGAGVLVSDEERPSSADYQIVSPEEVEKLFGQILSS